MDDKLVAWARAVKARQKKIAGAALPVLWLFTDAGRLEDPRAAVRRLPRGLCGVVLRHDQAPDRAALGRDLARICRQRHTLLVLAGDWRLAAALGVGRHVRGGHGPRRTRHLVTSSAHSMVEATRAARIGAGLVFLSPAFATASHVGATGHGALRWGLIARRAGIAVAALGGIDGVTVRQLPPKWLRAVGAIGALA